MIKGLYTAAPGCDVLSHIAKSLAHVTKGDMEALRQCLILLPTRRAIRVLEEKLLDAFQLPTVLLPHIMAIGDIELPPEDEDSGRLPPRSISGLERIVSLLPYLQKHGLGGTHFDGQWRMAQEVARLIDLLQTEDLEIDAIGNMIAAADLAAHWQGNGGLFENVAKEWLYDLSKKNVINSAAGRTLRIQNLTDQWHDKLPQAPLWLIGSTGSIPAVRRLMKQVLSLPHGAVLLPGVDTIMHDAEWAAMSDAHPQEILKQTISELGYDRREVKSWPNCHANDSIIERQRYLSAALSPFPKMVPPVHENSITIINAPTQQQEAECIAHYCIRHFQDAPQKSLSIIANDPAMTQRLLPLLSPYDIHLDPSAGLSIGHSGFGQALAAFLRLLSPEAHIIDLWLLLKRDDFAPYWRPDDKDKILADIEKNYLRDPLKTPESVIALLDLFPENTFQNLVKIKKNIAELKSLPVWAGLILDALPEHFSMRSKADKMAFDCAIKALEDIKSLPIAHEIPYQDTVEPICDHLMRMAIRNPYQKQRSVQILGTMEARLMHADIVIMAGLNESIWPDTPQPSPFISRGMRHSVGLPDTERHAALAGHDFQQAFLMPEIIITYANRDSDAPLLPARWLLRLKAATDSKLWNVFIDKGNAIMRARRTRHAAITYEPAIAPAPVAKKNDVTFPLYVTQMETWRRDPYSFWAKHIVRLRKTDLFLGEVDAATRGTLWHTIFKIFAEKYDTHDNKKKIYDECITDVLAAHGVPAHKQRAWKNRLEKLSADFLTYEEDRRSYSHPIALEKEWEGKIGDYGFKAKADRVDLSHGDSLLLLDYKTGAPPLVKDIESGISCQLSLLALLMEKPVYELEYLAVTGGRPPIKSVKKIWDGEFAKNTHDGVIEWVKLFLECGHPFISLADFTSLKNKDYIHLSRHDEWGMEA